MAAVPTPDREAEALSRFQDDEKALEGALDEARREAEGLLASARSAADAIRAAAEQEAVRAVSQMREDAAAGNRRLGAELERGLGEQIAEITKRAKANEGAALAWILAIVAGDPQERAP